MKGMFSQGKYIYYIYLNNHFSYFLTKKKKQHPKL